MSDHLKLSDWIQAFNQGQFDKADVNTQIKAGWFDWFCKDSSLRNKTKQLGSILNQFLPGGKIDLANSYVMFKNNSPIKGPLYDDFRIADCHSDITLLVVQVDCVRNDKKYVVLDRLTHFEHAIFKTDSVTELVRWLNEGWN